MMPELASVTKRIVLHYLTGVASGLSQIIGLTDKQSGPVLDLKMADGTMKLFHLVSAGPRSIHYREQTPVVTP